MHASVKFKLKYIIELRIPCTLLYLCWLSTTKLSRDLDVQHYNTSSVAKFLFHWLQLNQDYKKAHDYLQRTRPLKTKYALTLLWYTVQTPAWTATFINYVL